MKVTRPHDLHTAFVDAFNRGDLNALLALYEKDATLFPEPGVPLVGIDAISRALADFIAMKGRMRLDTISVVESAGLAITRGEWTLKGGVGPDGKPVELAGKTLEVSRRQPDGSWLMVIDDPYGG